MSKKKHTRPNIVVMGGGLRDQLARAGAESVYVMNTDPKAAEEVSRENVHALVLTGGSDVAPELYGATRHSQTQSSHHARDEAEIRAVHAAFKRGIPIFGICRGSQLINVAFGGTLHQHITDKSVGAHKWHLGHDHRVKLKQRSRIRQAMGVKEPWVVSIHHQAVDKIADGFIAGAHAHDGIIESIESKRNAGLPWIVATQFHPEIQTRRAEQKLFDEFVREAAKFSGLPTPVPFEPPAPAPIKYSTPTYSQGGWTTPTWTKPETPSMSPKSAKKAAEIIVAGGKVMDWTCFRCAMKFDLRSDHIDHMYTLHDIDLIPLLTELALDQYLDEIGATADEETLVQERWLQGV